MTDTTPTPTPGTQTILKRFGATPQELADHFRHVRGATGELVTLTRNAANAADHAARMLLAAVDGHADVLRYWADCIHAGRGNPPHTYETSASTLSRANREHTQALWELDRAVTALDAAFRADLTWSPPTNLPRLLAAAGALLEGPNATFPAGPIDLPTGRITLPETLTAYTRDGELVLRRDGRDILEARTQCSDDPLAQATVLYAALRTYAPTPVDAHPAAVAEQTLPIAAELLGERTTGTFTMDAAPAERYPYVRDEEHLHFISITPGEFSVYRLLDDEDELGDSITEILIPRGAPCFWSPERLADLLVQVFTATFT
ncbi:hypothetical protein [Embleya sp. NBC_00896]|uniref:hypothetical protein n=1 Tax=Embleya sp. NBC_00896 TaxID=2975961 RepID=UPI002F911180|nr:hypothetical protein OG928_48585 [Embleya sp. NBC_00896]